jgi:hypothetical protein
MGYVYAIENGQARAVATSSVNARPCATPALARRQPTANSVPRMPVLSSQDFEYAKVTGAARHANSTSDSATRAASYATGQVGIAASLASRTPSRI